MAAKPVKIAIIANAAQAKRELNSFSSSLSDKFKKVGKVAAVGAAVAGAALLKIGADSVKAASDSQQSLGATETVFGKYADGVIKNSKRAATAIGLSANEYRELSNVTGALLSGAGMPLKKVAGLTDDLNKRASDMAATFGGTTRQAVESISSLMKGEADPIEKYGVSIKQSDVSARLAAKGLDKLTGSAKKQAEMQARLELLMSKTAKTQGAFKRESGTLAHQQQVLGAQFENLKAKIGSILLPVLTALFTFMNNTAIPALTTFGSAMRDKLAPYVDKARDGFKDLMKMLEPVGNWLRKHPEVIKGIGIGLGIAAGAAVVFAAGMGLVALATSPITLTVLAIAALAGGIAYAYKNSETFRTGVAKVGEIAMQVFGWMQTNVLPILTAIGAYYVAVFNRLRSTTQTLLGVIQSLWRVFGGTITAFLTNTFKNLKTVVEGGLKVIRGIIKTVTSIIKGDWSGAWNGIKTILSGAWGVIRGIVSQGVNIVKSVMSGAWAAIKGLTSAAWNAMKTKVSSTISDIVGYAKGIPGKVTGALGDLSGLLKDIGFSIIDGLLQGMKDAWDNASGWLSSKAGEIKDLKGPPAKDKIILVENGKLIMKGFLKGLKNGWVSVAKYLSRVTQYVKAVLDKRYDGAALRAHTRAVLRSLKDEYRAIQRNEAAQDRVNKRLAAVKKLLADRTKAAKDYVASVKASVISTGNITSLGQSGDGSSSISNLITELKNKVNNAKRYASLIAQLTKDSLNKTSLQQLIDAGVEGGLATAEALASGGKQALSEVNSLTKELAATGTALGTSTAKTMYGAGIEAANGLIKGLNTKAKQLDRAAVRLANVLVRAVKRALGIKSPSRVFKGLGDNVTKGLVIGLDEYRVKKAGQALSSSLQQGFGEPALQAFATASAQQRSSVAVKLTSEQVSQLQRGREIQMDLNAYKAVGGRVSA
ncbi:phage tail protein [Nocardioides sp. Soil796]|uniref:phage tail protein n=1 Tax=Nocardioides sp. Soil796 TaxID=1736412 RepID=UPI00070B0EE2|nr:hypothetical protein [Nocardioides sp. Soil796]KRF19664.1 hypothetical protein ASH02_24220 [Nocardioides sp. Soil796]